jgi:hypothetical protein
MESASPGPRETATAAPGRVEPPFATLTGFLVVTVTTKVRENPCPLAFLLEAPQGAFEALILRDDHF